MIVNFGSENLVPDVGSGFCPFPMFSNTTGSFGLKVGQHISSYVTSDSIITTKYLKGTATMFYMKALNEPSILIPVSSKSVEKCVSCWRLNIWKWTVMEAAIL